MVAFPDALYDAIADEYAEQFARTSDPDSVWAVALRAVEELIAPVAGLTICDLGCGEGTLCRRLADAGAARVVGVDVSERMLAYARARTDSSAVSYLRDDAQHLTALPDAAFDGVVSSLALMDIPDLPAVCAAVFRVLRPGGRFAFSVTHPCFQMPRTPRDGETGIRYDSEGYWRSDNAGGIRGRVGAWHRTLSTCLNTLAEAGFTLRRVHEPGAALREWDGKRVPSVLAILAQK